MTIQAAFLNEEAVGIAIPSEWSEYVRGLVMGDHSFWMHFFLWETYHLLELTNFESWEGVKVLEPGCGNGVVGCLLSMLGAEVTLLDYDESVLDGAREHARNLGVDDQIDYVKADLFEPPMDEHSFDLVWNDGVIEHFDDPVDVLRAMVKMTKEGGQVMVDVPHKWTLNTYFIRPLRRARNAYPFDRWGREKSYSQEGLKAMMISAGLSDIETSVHHLRRAFMDDYLILPPLQGKLKSVGISMINVLDMLEYRVPGLSNLGFTVGAAGYYCP